jgi:hypothetical protein
MRNVIVCALHQVVIRVIKSRADHSGRAVFALSKGGIVGSNPIQGMRLICVCGVLRVGSGLETG